MGEEQVWLRIGIKSQLLFIFPPGIFHQFRKLIQFFAVHLKSISWWAIPVMDERQMITFLGTFVFRSEPEKGSSSQVRVTGSKRTKRSWSIRINFLIWYHGSFTCVICNIEAQPRPLTAHKSPYTHLCVLQIGDNHQNLLTNFMLNTPQSCRHYVSRYAQFQILKFDLLNLVRRFME